MNRNSTENLVTCDSIDIGNKVAMILHVKQLSGSVIPPFLTLETMAVLTCTVLDL